MADSFNKKERDKKKRKKKQDKADRKKALKASGAKSEEFLYMDEDGNLTPTPPDPTKKKKVFKLEDMVISVPKQSELEPENKIKVGLVKFYDEEKRFGFISESGSHNDFFVHADNLIDRIKERDKVEFELGAGPKGVIAINVKQWKEKKKVPKVEPKKEGAVEGDASKKDVATDATKTDAPKVDAAKADAPPKAPETPKE